MSEDTVDFWFDPACPGPRITSRWILEVEKVRPVEIHWREMSLAIINESQEMSAEYRRVVELGRGTVRVFAAARKAVGDDAVGELYTTLGTRFHGGDGLFQRPARRTREPRGQGGVAGRPGFGDRGGAGRRGPARGS